MERFFEKIFETFVTWSFLIFFNTFTSKSHFFLHPCCRKSKNWKKFRIFWPKLSKDEGLMLLYINVKYQNASLQEMQNPVKKGNIETHLILIIFFLFFPKVLQNFLGFLKSFHWIFPVIGQKMMKALQHYDWILWFFLKSVIGFISFQSRRNK